MNEIFKYKLQFPELTSEDIANIKQYCTYMGYVFDDKSKKELIPLIRKSNSNRFMYIQKIKGELWAVYGSKRENLSEIFNFVNTFSVYIEETKKINFFLKMKKIIGLMDFEFFNHRE